MSASVDRYVEAYVAARRIERQIARHEAEWQRWLKRVQLARALGDEYLTEAARQRALAHGDAAARLRMTHVEQHAVLGRLEALVDSER
jgi:hypothetical protein